MSGTSTLPRHTDKSDRVLSVQGLNVGVNDLKLVHDVSFSIAAGERVGLIGESGSGKSLTSLSVMGLLSESLQASGSITLAGVEDNLLNVDERRFSQIRGKNLSMVFQEPMTALNPTMKIGKQVAETLLLHGSCANKAAARTRAIELLDLVGIPNPEVAVDSFPHQFSGGQRQRVVLALALANDPALIICDEPTTALDVTVQERVLQVILRSVREQRSALLFITHDLAVVAQVCERVLVMYGGRIVESGPVHEVFTRPRHRYTEGLIAASALARMDERGRLFTIPGSVPPAGQFPVGCVFRNRCTHADDACATMPSWTTIEENVGFACHHPTTVQR